MNDKSLLDNPIFEQLPYRVESNKNGIISMTPHFNDHSDYQIEIAFQIKNLLTHGRVSIEFLVLTDNGERTMDVCWRTRIVKENRCTVMPELCIEVKSSSNTLKEMYEKKDIYLQGGAKEFWICIAGEMNFYDINGPINKSILFPSFPDHVSI